MEKKKTQTFIHFILEIQVLYGVYSPPLENPQYTKHHLHLNCLFYLFVVVIFFHDQLQSLLSQQYDKHPIFILKDVKFQELRAMMDYMYRGEVNISQDQLAALLKAAESLQIKGLSDNRSGSSAKGGDSAQQQKQQVPASASSAGSAAKTGLTIEQNNKRPNAELTGGKQIG